MNYEINSVWNPYYEELDTDKRKALLEELTSTQPDDGANDFRKRIFNYRYVDEKKPEHTIDRFLWIGCMFRDINHNASLFTFFEKKQVAKYVKELGLDQVASLSSKEKACLYQEYKHAFKRYLESCMSGNYHSLFGMVQPEDEKRIAAAKGDIRSMSTGIAAQFHLEDSFTLWTDAATDLLNELESKQ